LGPEMCAKSRSMIGCGPVTPAVLDRRPDALAGTASTMQTATNAMTRLTRSPARIVDVPRDDRSTRLVPLGWRDAHLPGTARRAELPAALLRPGGLASGLVDDAGRAGV